jgi:hypothetical protein
MEKKNGKTTKVTPLPASIADCARAMDSAFHWRKVIGTDELARAAGCSPQKAQAQLSAMGKMKMVEKLENGYRLTPEARLKIRATYAG